jgi:hypothetical protein
MNFANAIPESMSRPASLHLSHPREKCARRAVYCRAVQVVSGTLPMAIDIFDFDFGSSAELPLSRFPISGTSASWLREMHEPLGRPLPGLKKTN